MGKNCLNCCHCIPIGEGDHICVDSPTPMVVLDEYLPTDDYGWCHKQTNPEDWEVELKMTQKDLLHVYVALKNFKKLSLFNSQKKEIQRTIDIVDKQLADFLKEKVFNWGDL